MFLARWRQALAMRLSTGRRLGGIRLRVIHFVLVLGLLALGLGFLPDARSYQPTPTLRDNNLWGTRSFQSPSGNIWCVYRSGSVGCSVGNLGRTAYLGKSGSGWSRPGVLSLAYAPVLSYGAYWMAPGNSGLQCGSRREGVVCTSNSAADHAFLVKRAGIKVY